MVVSFLGNSFAGLGADDIAAQFPAMLDDPMGGGNPLRAVWPYFFIFAGITTWLVARGVNAGIETAAKLLMPLFFILLLGLAAYSIISGMPSGGTTQAVSFMFTPDFSKITPEVAVSALGQACFSIGIGNAINSAWTGVIILSSFLRLHRYWTCRAYLGSALSASHCIVHRMAFEEDDHRRGNWR